jgi:all-beta uncharacterized protein/BACON domain-containing protein
MREKVQRTTRHLVLVFTACIAVALVYGCGSSATTSTSPSTITRCGVTLGVADSTVPAEGGSGRITVTTERECAWTAQTEVSWLSLTTAASGQGDGFVDFRVAANADPVTRRGTILFNNQRAELSQSAAECVITLGEHSANLSQAGGTGNIPVVASSPMCTWTASVNVDWISITSATGKGTATVPFTVAATTGPPRTATINIGGQLFSVTQSQGCTYAIDPQSRAFGASGGSGAVSVSTAAGCPWFSGSNVPWIAVTQGAADSGPGAVNFTVEATTGASRTGTLVIAGNAFTVTQSSGCSFQVSPTTQAASAGGGTGTVTVVAPPGCGWSASSGVSWITVTGGSSGNGNGTVTFSVQATTGPSRTGTLTVANQTVSITQSQGCSFSISPEAQSFDLPGGSGEVAVTAAGGCSWSATSNVPWITITQGANGTGNGNVRFTVASTTGPTRSGTLTIAGRTFTVTQGPLCTITLSPESTTISASGGSRTFNVQASGGCSWTATSNAPWITIGQGGSGNGNGSVRVDIAANSGEARTGTVSVAGRTFTVQQDGACSFSLTQESTNAPAGASTVNVGVQAAAGCSWTATSNATWITITNGASGTGNGTVTLAVAANTGGARPGTVTIGGRTFTVNQAGTCSFAIAPQQQSVPAAGASVGVNVTTAAACTWTSVSNAPWITVTQGASGTGNATVTLSVSANVEPARTGTATIAGQTYTVQQASGCTFAVSPGSRSASASGGSNMFNVSAIPACSWTAVSEVPWIRIDQGTGSGNGKVDYTVMPNTGPARTGTIRVGNAVFSVMQSGS